MFTQRVILRLNQLAEMTLWTRP